MSSVVDDGWGDDDDDLGLSFNSEGGGNGWGEDDDLDVSDNDADAGGNNDNNGWGDDDKDLEVASAGDNPGDGWGDDDELFSNDGSDDDDDLPSLDSISSSPEKVADSTSMDDHCLEEKHDKSARVVAAGFQSRHDSIPPPPPPSHCAPTQINHHHSPPQSSQTVSELSHYIGSLERILSSINAVLEFEYNTLQKAEELLEYYQSRPQLAEYTRTKELKRMNYEVVLSHGHVETNKERIILDNLLPDHAIVSRAANQSLLADLLQVITGQDLIVRPQYLTICVATWCKFTIHQGDHGADMLDCRAKLSLSLPTVDGDRLLIAEVAVCVLFSPGQPMVEFKVQKIDVLLEDYSKLAGVAEFLNAMEDNNNEDTITELLNTNTSPDMYRDAFLEKSQRLLSLSSEGMKSAFQQMDSVVNIKGKIKKISSFIPDTDQLLEAEQEAMAFAEARKEELQQRHSMASFPRPPPPPPPPPRVEIARPIPPPENYAFGATAPRSLEREKEIYRGTVYGTVSFGPPRPPRKNMPTVAEAAKEEGRPTMLPPCPPQPTTSEMAFFERAKRHLSRRELAPDKPTARSRHTPYTEFLKCLHLFGSGVLNKDELVLLLRGLFVQGHAPKSGVNAGGGASNPAIATDAHNLLNEFQEILIGRGPYADQLTNQKDKSKYGALRCRDVELSTKISPSYAEYPKDYSHDLFMSHTGQTEGDAQVLNSTLVSVGKDRTQMCSTKTRRNAYEDVMFRIEDERFEVDMAIDRNALAMRKTEPIADEVQMLREGEEKDGQPIGRLQYKLNARTLNSVHINSIGRIYGENGDEVIQYLARNPLAVLPIIYQRLRQKDLEWRKQKSELISKWKVATEANYEGSLDHTCFSKRRALEKSFGLEQLRDECKQARQYCSNQNKLNDSPVSFGLSVPDKSAVFYQPYASVEMKSSSSVHHNAVGFLIKHIGYRCTPNPDAREKVGRIWTEFLLPFFGYPSFWVLEESRQSYQGKISNAVVQYAVGERVMTAFGEGTIVAFEDGIDSEEGPRYRVKLSFGYGHLQPYAILHNVDTKDGSKYTRRNDEMIKETNSLKKTSELSETTSSVVVDKKFKLLFGSDSIYLFLRLYGFLISLLDDIKEHLRWHPTMIDLSKSYYNPMKSLEDKGKKEKAEEKLNFASVASKLSEVVAKKMSLKEFETFARRVNRDITYKIAALPKLVERCGDMMVKMSEEDLLPSIFDVCQYSGQCPVTLRSACMAMSPTAEYRIQYNTKLGRIYFSYLPEDEELSTTLPGDDDDDDDDDEDDDDDDDGDDDDDDDDE
mmetsp:Transcript_19028/g.39863  ORF Transcript_19028/g.39863 Transcript_19028/m.39863 type:complete len:1294 (+) Transcript_19028:65-3946(+)